MKLAQTFLSLVLVLLTLPTFAGCPEDLGMGDPGTYVNIEKIRNFVREHCARGDCQCRRCMVSEGTPEKPKEHKVSVAFFDVGLKGSPDAEEFRRLMARIMPEPDQEISYILLGGELGDQQLALEVMGLGQLLGVWKLRSPATELPGLPEDLYLHLAQRGMITISGLIPAPTP